jgi:hypothetical protein
MSDVHYNGRDGKMVVTVEGMRRHRGNLPGGNMFAFLDEMRALLDRVPPEHRAAVQIFFGAIEDEDGYPELQADVFYTRDETEAERAARVASHRDWVADQVARLRSDAELLCAEAGEFGLDLAALGVVVTPQALKLARKAD